MNAAASTQHKEQLQYLFINKPNSITMGDLYRLYDFNGEGDSHVNVRVQKSLLNILFRRLLSVPGSLQHNFRNAAAHQIYQ